MHIIHWDKKYSIHLTDIVNWRSWAQQNGYRRTDCVSLTVKQMTIIFEIFRQEEVNFQDTYLFYHPQVGNTENTETLFILPNEQVVEQMLWAGQIMATSIMKILQDTSR